MKTVLVTGASGNLGRDLVDHLHQRGYAILATLGSPREIDRFNHLPHVRTQVVNVLDERSVTAFFDDNATLPIHAAVLLVGGFAMGTLEETTSDMLQTMYERNFLSAFQIVKPLMTQFKRQKHGQFILIGARPSLRADEGKNAFAYAISKTLVFKLAELINADGNQQGVQATVVVPGIIDTPANRAAMPDADPANWVPTDNLAELITFLLSDTGRMTHETVVKIYNQS